MNVPKNPVLIGIIAGLVAAILVAGSVDAIAFIVLFIAGLGYGRLSGIVAMAIAAVALVVVSSSIAESFISVLTLLPVAVMSHLATLGRPATEIGGPEATTAWYPLSDILLAGAVLTALGTICYFLLMPAELLEPEYKTIAEQFLQVTASANPTTIITAEIRQAVLQMVKAAYPIWYAAIYMLMLFAGFYLAMRILTAFKRNIRPREDIRSSLRMNRPAIGILIGSIALMFADETLTLIGKSVTGAMVVGFVLSGYALFHEILRQKSWGSFALLAIYIASIFLTPVMLIVLAGGLANPRRAVALTPNKPDIQQSNLKG